MRKMSLLCLIIFISTIFLSFSVSALTDAGNQLKITKTDEPAMWGMEKETNFSKFTKSHEEKSDDEKGLTESAIDAVETAFTNGGKELLFWIPDSFLKAGLSMSSANLSGQAATGSSKLTYSLYSEEINFLDIPFITQFLILTGITYYVLFFNALWIALGVLALQTWKPQTYSEIRLSVLGEEKHFNIFSMWNVYGFGFLWPILSFTYIMFAIYIRNFVTMAMTTQIIEGIGVNSDSLPTYFILCVGYYFNIVQKMLAEYGVYLFITLDFVIGGYYVYQLIFGSQKAVWQDIKRLAKCFAMLLSLDIITIFFIWFGVNMTIRTGSEGYSIAAVVIAFIVGLVILLKVILKTTLGRQAINFIARV